MFNSRNLERNAKKDPVVIGAQDSRLVDPPLSPPLRSNSICAAISTTSQTHVFAIYRAGIVAFTRSSIGTADSGSVVLGSSPSRAARENTMLLKISP